MDLDMILAGQSTNKDLQNRYVADLHPRREPAVSRPDESQVRYNDMLERPAGVERIANTSKTKLAHFEDVIIDGSHRLLLPSGLAGRFWLIGGALIAASCWVLISLLPLPFALAPAGKQRESSVSSTEASDIKKGDRLQIPSAAIRAPVSEISRETATSAVSPDSSSRPSPTEVQRQTKVHSGKTPRHTPSITARSRDLDSAMPLVPTPDTKPTTIAGWTLREVTNGTALIEGPNGIWRVGRGDTVPGLGRVDSIFRWGNRLMVATSGGLISTP